MDDMNGMGQNGNDDREYDDMNGAADEPYGGGEVNESGSRIKFRSTRRANRRKRATMYVTLAMCMIALGIGSWSAINRARTLTGENDGKTQASITEEAGANRTDIPRINTTQAVNLTTAAAKSTTAGTTLDPAVASFFTMPVGGRQIKGFSSTELQYSDTFCDWRIHEGIDIAADLGTEIYCSGNGVVKEVFADAMLGNTVVIDHGNGIIAYYSGLNSSLVKAGELVEAGQVLGGIGNIPSECVEAAHLHFAVKLNGVWVDPITSLHIVSH